VDDVTVNKVQAFIEKHVDTSAHVSTDEYPIYKNLSKRGYINHGIITHAIEEYRRGEISTNTVEGSLAS